MSLNFTYVAELENLIINTLLPVYANYQTRMGSSDRYAGINPELLKLIKKDKQLPALLRDWKKQV